MRLRETAPWLAVFAVILAGVLVWNGLWGILFEHNDQYRIRTLEIVPGALTTREEIVSVAGLREGDGLFAKGADEIRRTLVDAHGAGASIVYLGQYLRPTPLHTPVRGYLSPDHFAALGEEARRIGFAPVKSAPFVRSSYPD